MSYTKMIGLQKFNLVPSSMRNWPRINWCVFLICLAINTAIVGTVGYYYTKAHIQWYYLGLLIFILCLLLLPAIALKKTRNLHVHHYNVGQILFVLIAY